MQRDERDPSRGGDYRQARIGAAAGLVAVLMALLIWDGVSIDYHLETGTLVVVAATILSLLGIEALSLIRGSGGK